MKKTTLTLIALFSISGLTLGQTADDTRPPRPPQEIVEQFDVDGDGRLNESERKALRESGQFQPPSREEALQRFDTDGDGQLSQSEREAARQSRPSCTGRKQRGQRGGGGGR